MVVSSKRAKCYVMYNTVVGQYHRIVQKTTENEMHSEIFYNEQQELHSFKTVVITVLGHNTLVEKHKTKTGVVSPCVTSKISHGSRI